MTAEVEKVIVTASPDAPPDGAIIHTPIGQPNLQVKVMGRVHQIAIRTIRTYLQSLVGFLVAGGTGAVEALGDMVGVDVHLPARDFMDLFLVSASMSLAPAVISLLQNTVELLSELEKDKPELRA